jgi:hypothetical protein
MIQEASTKSKLRVAQRGRFFGLTVGLMFTAFCASASFQSEFKATTTQTSDTLIYRNLDEIIIHPRKGRKMSAKEYARLVKKIKKVYPYAKIASKELEKYNEKFVNIKSEREKKKYIKTVEKQMFNKFETSFKKLTVSEGRYLMLLIDRETGDTSYALIKELKGTLPAMFWQGIARVFGNSLKDEYDPVYKHFVIEQIVLMIERGEL